MSDWTAGYVADIGYTYGYYEELNPLRARLAFLNQGFVCPEFKTACELGFGQGISANIHAAASAVRWYGTDFNPSQAGFAKELAEMSGAGAELFDESFDEFAERKDLPDFDFIGVHGIWSWISDANRKVIVDFVRRKLKVGGVLYISYNTLPGWAAFAPMRHLMAEHAGIIGTPGKGIVTRVDEAMEFADSLMETKPLFARANPLVGDKVKKLKTRNRHYLAHEFLNRDWHPMHVATMAEWLQPAKLGFACSAHYMDHIDTLNFTAEQHRFLKEIPDRMFRESVRDYMVNQQFRRDYWVKGVRTLSPVEHAEALREHKILLISHRPDISLKITGPLGEANMSESVYTPLLDLLADHQVRTIGQVETALSGKGIEFAKLFQAVMILDGAGHLGAVQSEKVASKVKQQSAKLNQYLVGKSRDSGEIEHLTSPVTGGGIAVNKFQQLFLLALSQGKKQPAEWAEFACDALAKQGQKVVKEGKALDNAKESLAEVKRQAETFAAKRLPILKALQIA
ncbi:MAG: class I SAM-dependent methyltransferase [Pseudohongiellaceae bacterium]